MTIRAKLLSILGGGLILMLIVVFFVFRVGRETTTESSETTSALSAPVLIDAPVPTPEVEEAFRIVNPPPAPADIAALARSFTERYGSFSNQGNFENLEELLSFMTPAMARRTEATIAAGRAAARPGDAYVGITTRALNVRVVDQTAGGADIEVATQRRSVRGTAAAEVIYQTLAIALVKDGDTWNIENATWK